MSEKLLLFTFHNSTSVCLEQNSPDRNLIRLWFHAWSCFSAFSELIWQQRVRTIPDRDTSQSNLSVSLNPTPRAMIHPDEVSDGTENIQNILHRISVKLLEWIIINCLEIA